jgi:ribokinase
LNILVIGSFMMDLVVRTPRVPHNGETVIGTHFNRFPGGKGANQAVAAARLGGKVTMVGKLGEDPFGDDMLQAMEDESINTKHILRDEEKSTGVGSVTIDDQGNNRIVVVPGANLMYSVKDLFRIEHLIKASDILMLQLEMDIGMIEQAVEIAHIHRVPVILNPAPAQKLKDDTLKKVTYITPNETESEILTGIKVKGIEDAKAAGKVLLEKGVQNVVITLADKGAVLINSSEVLHVPGYPVEPIDTVAAGDAFNGALAFELTRDTPLAEAVRIANVAGALAVTKEGAIPSLPYSFDIEAFLKQSKKIIN